MKENEWRREWARLGQEERRLWKKRQEKRENRLEQLLAEKVPDKLEETLETAFVKAFGLIFEKGTPLLEKSYDLTKLAEQYLLDDYALKKRGEGRDLRSFSRRAGRSAAAHTLVSGASGVGLGLLGIGLADIPLFTSLLLRNLYEIGMRFGFDYEGEEEQGFLLRLIAAALSWGDEFHRRNVELNAYITAGFFPKERDRKELIDEAARALARELLLMKFLQGVPVAGALGGALDAVYMARISEYASLKYRRRFYWARRPL